MLPMTTARRQATTIADRDARRGAPAADRAHASVATGHAGARSTRAAAATGAAWDAARRPGAARAAAAARGVTAGSGRAARRRAGARCAPAGSARSPRPLALCAPRVTRRIVGTAPQTHGSWGGQMHPPVAASRSVDFTSGVLAGVVRDHDEATALDRAAPARRRAPSASSSSSSLTAMRSAWNVRDGDVAVPTRGGGHRALDGGGELGGARRRRGEDRLGDGPAEAALAVRDEQRGERRPRRRARGTLRPSDRRRGPSACRAAPRSGTRSPRSDVSSWCDDTPRSKSTPTTGSGERMRRAPPSPRASAAAMVANRARRTTARRPKRCERERAPRRPRPDRGRGRARRGRRGARAARPRGRRHRGCRRSRRRAARARGAARPRRRGPERVSTPGPSAAPRPEWSFRGRGLGDRRGRGRRRSLPPARSGGCAWSWRAESATRLLVLLSVSRGLSEEDRLGGRDAHPPLLGIPQLDVVDRTGHEHLAARAPRTRGGARGCPSAPVGRSRRRPSPTPRSARSSSPRRSPRGSVACISADCRSNSPGVHKRQAALEVQGEVPAALEARAEPRGKDHPTLRVEAVVEPPDEPRHLRPPDSVRGPLPFEPLRATVCPLPPLVNHFGACARPWWPERLGDPASPARAST